MLKQKFWKYEGQFDLKGQDQGHQFQNPSETFRCSKNRSNWKVKFENVQFLTVKAKFCKFKGQFDLEDKGQVHKFSKWCETFDDQ